MVKKHDLIVIASTELEVTVSCIECDADLEAKVRSYDQDSITVEVEPHTCKESS